MKTAAVARVDVEVASWADVGPGRGTLAFLLPPGALRPNAYRKLKKTIDRAIEAQQEAADRAEKTATPKDEPYRPEALPRGGVDAPGPDAG